MERILKSKKAQSGVDTIFAVATIFGLVVFCLVITYTYAEFVDTVKNTTMNNTPQAITAMEGIEDVNAMWDYVIFAIFIGFALTMLILGYFVQVDTIFFPIYVIVLLIGVIISGVLSYVWDKLTEPAVFSAIETSHFPIMSHVMEYLVLYYIIIGVIGLIATYAKTREGI